MSSLIIVCPISHAKTFESYQLENNQLTVLLDEANIQFAPVNSATIEVNYTRADMKSLPSFALAEAPQDRSFTLTEGANTLTFASAELIVEITKSPFSVAYYKTVNKDKAGKGKQSNTNKKRILLSRHNGGFFHHDALRGVRFALQANEKILGGGQRVMGMDRRGKRLPLNNKTHWSYTDYSDGMYYSLSGIMSSKGYIIAFDNSAKGHMDIGASTSDVLQFEAVAGRNAYLFSVGDDYSDLINNFTDATGKQPLPPRWALGSFASRFGYHNEAEVRNVVTEYQKQDFPLDTVILDLFWFGKDVKGHMGSLQWDTSAFPNPDKMLQDFSSQGIKTLLVTEPYIIQTSKNWENAVAAEALAKNPAGGVKEIDMFFGRGGLVDVFSEKGRDWFWQFYQQQFEQGVAGVWGDLGEPEAHPDDTIHALGSANSVHNAFGHQWASLIHENYQEQYPNKRLFLLMRSGFLGSQRFGMMPWTGDVSRSWGGLGAQVELSLQMGILGLGYTHSDLGGFATHEVFDAELYIRWLQYGVFQPVYRVHGFESVAPEPIFHDEHTKNIVRDYMKLRYRMLPYNYTLAYENSVSGMPMMRPLFFDEAYSSNSSHHGSESSAQKLAQAIDYRTGYFWGDAFWIEPVIAAHQQTQTTFLPEGIWFDFWQEQLFRGGKYVTIPINIQTLPVWVKAGSFVPMIQPINNTEAYDGAQVELHYYHHKSVESAEGQWYEDDGKDAKALVHNQYRLFKLSAKTTPNELMLTVNSISGGYVSEPKQRSITWVVHQISNKPSVVTLNNQPISFTYDEESKQLSVPVKWQADLANRLIKVKIDV
ncbi:glycoside hydrolase family 31 protein [Alteromonas sp. a30]|uniref:glycoside hydrolase family 31 protein n=1 Tax=Alteromonas sp. a30 TaxID=2730917 RepID=UPI00228254F8|nr:TIM-barrel domain-containing protein [Alteromonas sp. a30]MCY7296432.1 DUF5110 domain-containing protein [Alteromonas sp. a30]